jgi:uncharacterized membrane protein YdbT with pleckstrin-like domain
MAYKRENLQAGEDIVLDLHPHWWFFTPAAASLVLAIVIGIASLALDWESWVRVPIALLILGTLLWFGVRYAQWATTDLVLTSHRLIYQSGVVSKSGIEIPLGRINTIFSSQGVMERIIGVGDLRVESASTEGAQVFENMKKPDRIRNEINLQMESTQMRYSGHPQQPAAPAEADALAQIERLAALRDQGSITEAEFQAKKAQLLDRM